MPQEKGERRNRGHHSNKNKINVGDKGREILESIDENNLVIQQFRGYSNELDMKHDKFEKLVKISRDITIESKRIIFLLHTLDKESKREAVLGEAKLRFENMGKTLFKNIAYELDGQDIYQYLRAYKPGLEEYVEAITFFQYLQCGFMQDWTELEKSLVYTETDKSKLSLENSLQPTQMTRMLITPNEYIMGIADLTGELMRKCINNLGTGDITSCYQTCNFVRNMHKGFLGCTNVFNKDMSKKLYTLKQSLTKMENVCYTIKVRGSEIPKHMLADVAIGAAEDYMADEDEGYQV
ncbi:PREDICTED: translin-associated protein X [Polistes dominula]|uniref:Translin-associated protein X n=1 Tax=Polistes dominula TaxID=743375 RepID=A0ABM1JAS4_POLDO|nr:PREDICTED: translin-associated protein X [Polistes dominula]